VIFVVAFLYILYEQGISLCKFHIYELPSATPKDKTNFLTLPTRLGRRRNPQESAWLRPMRQMRFLHMTNILTKIFNLIKYTSHNRVDSEGNHLDFNDFGGISGISHILVSVGLNKILLVWIACVVAPEPLHI